MSGNIHTILVGTDFSDGSERALEAALRLAEQLRATIDLLYVVPMAPPVLPEAVAAMPSEEEEVERALQQLRAIAARAPAGRVRPHVVCGDAVAGLLLGIERLGPDLVIVGSHGRGAILRALLGSVAEQLCRESPVPVMVIPPRARARVAEVGKVAVDPQLVRATQ